MIKNKRSKLKGKQVDLLVLLGMLAVMCAYSIVTAHNFWGKPLFVGVVMCVPATLYLGWRRPKPWKKIMLASTLFGLLCGFLFEFIQVSAGAYYIVPTVFPKLFGFLPPDNFLGHFLMSLLTFTFYEHFVNKESSKVISPRYRHILIAVIGADALLIAMHFLAPNLLHISYSYGIFGVIALVPLVRLLIIHPKYYRDVALMMPYFFCAYFSFELIAVKYKWWIYPSAHYLGYVQFLGLKFPFEEFFFWIMLYAATITSYYKTYLDLPLTKGAHQSKQRSKTGKLARQSVIVS